MVNAALRIPGPKGDHRTLFCHHDLVRDEIKNSFSENLGETPSEKIVLTLLMTDIVGSTSKLALLGDYCWAELLDQHDEIVRERVREFGGHTINTTGDGFITAFSGPTRAIHCARKIRAEVARLNIAIRVGIHIGECERRGSDISGLTVHIAARILGCASRGQVLISETVRDVTIGSGLDLRHIGAPSLKDVPGNWPLYEVRI
ncbi:hypothetical protein C1J03_20545 [Sulfitobacter sp. SK012]|uniref:adenylate/guanylate cyclase domain-containing protein n=1 Tax=Sulfitobacter sp. SK012 TaxID=1389005 RepID=UPI000E0BB539|nr:adenylate/guanylate cyclase domain-containing protein [Sulfitobacter sp. SK012]AXI48178.1 hypothetical protein C1J03_20545 [Sulfitobacter sp. SK012]